MRKLMLCLALACLAAAFVSCGSSRAGPGLPDDRIYAIAASGSRAGGAYNVVQPRRAVNAILRDLGLDGTDALVAAGQQDPYLNEVFGLTPDMIEGAVTYVSTITNGLSDIALVMPAPGMETQVREALSQYTSLRADSFRNYDILNAYSIASNAVVFSQGEFVVMLMLPDNEAAREILDLYIPQ